MKENFKDCLSMLLKHEGGFVDHPKDPGGATNKGVTKKVYDEYLGRECTIDELKNIPMDHVEEIYKKNYWDKVKGDDLPNGVDFSIFDWAVNSGPGRASKALQKVIGATQDGAIGPKTLQLVDTKSPKEIIDRVSEERENFYRSLKTFDTFGKGWIRRNDETAHFSMTLYSLKK
tara:strand:- start:9507 stop:10028 length:522 start_codon:yes stop_codon:yes gene_type:complete